MNLTQKIQEIRLRINALNLKKSGENKYAGFKYYELGDFLPQTNQLCKELGMLPVFAIKDDMAFLQVIDTDKPEQSMGFTSPIADAQVKGTTPVQSLGAVHTYLKRYLYINFLELTEGDVLDSQVGSGNLTEAKATEEQVQKLVGALTPERLEKMLQYYKVKQLEDLTVTQASQALEKLNG